LEIPKDLWRAIVPCNDNEEEPLTDGGEEDYTVFSTFAILLKPNFAVLNGWNAGWQDAPS
jgi:hypothetical protein